MSRTTPTPTLGDVGFAPATRQRALVGALRKPMFVLVPIVGISTAVRASISVSSPSPWILPDELLYAELAKAIAAGGEPAVRGVPALTWGVVYPILIAPAWAVFKDPMTAYHAALAINALVMSSAAVPAYLLARMFVGARPAVFVALMTVLVPSLSYTGVVMTENAFYPLFLWSVLLIARAVRDPTVGRQVAALVGVGLLTATRIQGVALLAAYLAALALYGLTGPTADRGIYLRRLRPTAVLVFVGGLSASVVLTTRDESGLGGRSGTFDALRLIEVPEWLAYLAGGLVLYVALIPAAATVVAITDGFRARAEEAQRLFASVIVPVLGSMLVLVAFVSASIDVDGTENLNERYVFYVVPLLFVGLALWAQSGRSRRRPTVWLVLAGCTALALLVPVERLRYNAGFQSVALVPWLELETSRALLALMLGVFLVAAGVMWLRGDADRLWIVVGVWMVIVGVLVARDNSNAASFYARAYDGQPADWVDRALPQDESAVVIWPERPGLTAPDELYNWLIVTEMFNRGLREVVRLGPPTYYESILPTVPVKSSRSRLVREDVTPLDARYALVACRMPVAGRVVAASPYRALLLIEAARPIRRSPRSRC